VVELLLLLLLPPSAGKYARGARTSLLHKVSNQRNNRLKTDFHEYVEANARYAAVRLSLARCCSPP
jgi:hypothetical protein